MFKPQNLHFYAVFVCLDMLTVLKCMVGALDILFTLIQFSDGKQGNKVSKLKVSIYGKLMEELQPLLQAII